MAVGYFWRRGQTDFRWKLQVEFSSQPGFRYDFTSRDFGEESSPVLELVYALTVHKSQGSEFGTVVLVLPHPCRLVSRELLYTVLTRQKNRVSAVRPEADTLNRTVRSLFTPPERRLFKPARFGRPPTR